MSYLIQYEPGYQAIRLYRAQQRARQLERQIANLEKKLWRAENPGWHESKRWGKAQPLSGNQFQNRLTSYAVFMMGDNEWRYAVVLSPGVSPIAYYKELFRRRSSGLPLMKAGWSESGFFTPFTAKAHKSRRQGKEVWIITWDIRRDC